MTDSFPLPAAFIDQMRSLLGPDWAALRTTLDTTPPVSVHLHPQRAWLPPAAWQPVPWSACGYYLPERPSFTLDPAFHGGAYYVQEASSMLIAAAVQALLPVDRPWRVLDLCAAPGGKSTLLTSLLPPGSWLLANEVIKSRYQILRYNLQKWGYANTFTSKHDVVDFAPLAGMFDLVLVDAPCSGEGLFRKDPTARQAWSPEHVTHCALRQRRILQEAVPLVAQGGVLLYSTCTYNTQENDDNARWLATRNGLSYEAIPALAEYPVESREYGYQAYPHRLAGEGFYLAAFRQHQDYSRRRKAQDFSRIQRVPRREQALCEGWLSPDFQNELALYTTPKGHWRGIPKAMLADTQILAQYLHRIEVGISLGQPKGRNWLPDESLAFSLHLDSAVPRVDLSRELALALLRKETPPIPDLQARGWHLVTYQNLGLAWVKGLGNRYNNYYPQNWRIRMQG
ncbi:MAG: RNA methyltransferase [Bacteroidetes bacterium]|nr:MAG: RNA methyltransferase [Bacteroidota bacterium]